MYICSWDAGWIHSLARNETDVLSTDNLYFMHRKFTFYCITISLFVLRFVLTDNTCEANEDRCLWINCQNLEVLIVIMKNKNIGKVKLKNIIFDIIKHILKIIQNVV